MVHTKIPFEMKVSQVAFVPHCRNTPPYLVLLFLVFSFFFFVHLNITIINLIMNILKQNTVTTRECNNTRSNRIGLLLETISCYDQRIMLLLKPQLSPSRWFTSLPCISVLSLNYCLFPHLASVHVKTCV